MTWDCMLAVITVTSRNLGNLFGCTCRLLFYLAINPDQLKVTRDTAQFCGDILPYKPLQRRTSGKAQGATLE